MKHLLVMFRLFCFTAGVLAAGCTTVGFHDLALRDKMDFGPSVKLRVCLLKDREVTQDQADQIKAALRDELLPYGIEVVYPWVAPWERRGFWSSTQVISVLNLSLVPPCDRIFALAGRNAGDFFWGLIMPEMLGAVEKVTYTRGLVVSQWGSLNQMLGFGSPQSIAVHEGYHLLGCDHALSMDDCYEKIRKIKSIAIQEQELGSDFFPTVTNEGHVLRTREEVDEVLYRLVQSYYAPESGQEKERTGGKN